MCSQPINKSLVSHTIHSKMSPQALRNKRTPKIAPTPKYSHCGNLVFISLNSSHSPGLTRWSYGQLSPPRQADRPTASPLSPNPSRDRIGLRVIFLGGSLKNGPDRSEGTLEPWSCSWGGGAGWWIWWLHGRAQWVVRCGVVGMWFNKSRYYHIVVYGVGDNTRIDQDVGWM